MLQEKFEYRKGLRSYLVFR